MRITRAVAAIAGALAVAALGFAGPARADQVMEGIYTYTQGDVVAEWTIYPSCVPTVGDLREELRLPVACRLHVASSTSSVLGGDARPSSGKWLFSKPELDGYKCPDGSTAPTLETYEFDDVAMTGTRTVSVNNACNNEVPASLNKYPFTLTFNRPLPMPVQQYPLYCEPGGLKRCF